MCGLEKPLENFSWKNKAKEVYQSQCRTCHKEYRKTHYLQNKQKYIDKAKRWRKEQRDWLTEFKRDKPCIDCGLTYNPWQMHFDHLRDKSFDLSYGAGRYNIPGILKEIAKCELVCANCHANRTHFRE